MNPFWAVLVLALVAVIDVANWLFWGSHTSFDNIASAAVLALAVFGMVGVLQGRAT
jgi:hypothetical protein